MTRILIILIILLLEIHPVIAATQCKLFSFKGVVKDKSSFKKKMGMDLSFRMEPSDDEGWTFEIGPANPGKDEWNNYIYTFNPPYRGRNITMLDISYATLAQNAVVNNSTVEFWFMSDRKDSAKATKALDKILWPDTDNAQKDGLNILGRLSMGLGKLHILNSVVVPGTAKPDDDPEHAFWGAIKEIQFEVDFYVSSKFKPAKGLRFENVSCPDSSAWIKQWSD